MQRLDQDLSRQSGDEKRSPTLLGQPLLDKGDVNEERYGATDTISPIRINVTPDSQIRRISSVQSNFDEAMVAGSRRGKLYTLVAFISLACLIATAYFCNQEEEGMEKELLFFLALMSGGSTFITGLLSCGYYYNNCRGSSCCGPDSNELSALIVSNPRYDEKKSAALDIIRSAGVEIKDETDPYQIQHRLNKIKKKFEDNNRLRLAFLSGNHPSLGEHSTVRTLFNGLGGGANPATTRHSICENIFEHAGMTLR